MSYLYEPHAIFTVDASRINYTMFPLYITLAGLGEVLYLSQQRNFTEFPHEEEKMHELKYLAGYSERITGQYEIIE